MSSFDSSTHRLAGSGSETGGLIKKKKNEEVDKPTKDEEFKKPSVSLLGLDVLARRKREQREAEEAGNGKFTAKRPKLDRDRRREQYDTDVRISFGKSDISKERRYRAPLNETPSHTGGVSEEALERIHHRMRREQGQGLYASTARTEDRNQKRRLRYEYHKVQPFIILI